ncbi:CDK5 and ABL1 enzyme substrate 2 isoform X1 [Hypomesus transpacificus]|uniref:CDK5 and ABL1 enzyme substrate 2 isoform X1 n=1 Tax=Hypomesus transpacificus TaxID=137520 RepID=UPI001F087FA7|nr:CDK5 and ABL1 enzyme substrate 2 isoform X1 [Hypomesus transpacificus]
MATAACSIQCASSNATKSHKEHIRKTKDSRRRQAALLFLNNISLDGRPLCPLNNGNIAQRETACETRRRDVGTISVGHLAFTTSSNGTAPQVSSSVTVGTVTSVPGIGALSPVNSISVTSTGTGASSGGNEVFVEIAVSDSTVYPLSPTPQTLHLSAKSVFSPVVQTNSRPLDSRQRSQNVSGSPGPKAAKKVHFIKSMRQYDTRGSRIMLICAKRSLYAAFSVLPYGESFHLSDPKVDAQRQRLSSLVPPDLLPTLEGLELAAYGKTVSYAKFLYPTNALVRQKNSTTPDNNMVLTPQSHFRSNNQRNFTPARLNSTPGQDPSIEDLSEYDPNLLSDPQWPCGRHKRVLIFASYVTTVIEYVKPSDLKKDMNETFKEKFPHIKLTLSKIRSLKRDMRAVSEECGLQPVTVAMAFVYFEKLVLQGRLNKQNRKLVAAACVLLAAKISSDLKKQEVRQLIDKLEERFRINRRELIPLEFPVLVALEMGLYLPESKVMPHYRRLVQQG